MTGSLSTPTLDCRPPQHWSCCTFSQKNTFLRFALHSFESLIILIIYIKFCVLRLKQIVTVQSLVVGALDLLRFAPVLKAAVILTNDNMTVMTFSQVISKLN